MASLERRYDGRYRIVFCYQGDRFTHSLGKVREREARSCVDRLEENLRFLERGLLDLPPDADLGVFLVSGGKMNGKPALEKSLTLAEFFSRYQKEHPDGAKEENTRYTEDIHIDHLLRLLGVGTEPLGRFAQQRLQCLGEISGRNPFEVPPGNKLLDGFAPAQVRRQ